MIHPQDWPEDLAYAGKRVVVIGSGATAVTLVPAMARDAAHVTMLQRSPTYIISLPAKDPIALLLRRLLSEKRAYAIVRWKNVLQQLVFFQLSRRRPKLIRRFLRLGAKRSLPPGYDVDTHFNPSYDPWDQRICLVPDADLFEAVSDGSATIVTGRIQTFTESGIRLESGEELEADVVITATGLNLQALGGARVVVDGREIRLPETVGYKGTMLSGVPNATSVVGYTNASWTLKADLSCQYTCRLLNHMREHGYDICTPTLPPGGVETVPFIDLKSGYVERGIHQFPKQGTHAPWRLYQNYLHDIQLLRRGEIEDGALRFARAPRSGEVEDDLARSAA